VVVDDDRDVQDLLEFMLEVDGRFRVVGRASDATEAVNVVERQRPDAVVLDLQLPGMDGITALPLIRRRAPEARIVVFSAFPDPFTLVDVLQLGADGYLNKNATWLELIPTLATLCQLAPAPA
jgi:DNA-binding NarL/FixJ family response regulator